MSKIMLVTHLNDESSILSVSLRVVKFFLHLVIVENVENPVIFVMKTVE